jgi:hypothetical protein
MKSYYHNSDQKRFKFMSRIYKSDRLLLSSLKQPLPWFRFIDDVDMKWTHGDKELPSLTVLVVSRKNILVFDTLCVNFIDGWKLLACSKMHQALYRHSAKPLG